MKIIVTGSLGHISKPLTAELIQKGHAVTVISSKPEKQKDIEALGATAAIGSLDLKWVIVSDEQSQNGLEAAGIQPGITAGLVEMYASIRNGKFCEDYQLHKPTAPGNVKLEDFAKEFAAAMAS